MRKQEWTYVTGSTVFVNIDDILTNYKDSSIRTVVVVNEAMRELTDVGYRANGSTTAERSIGVKRS
jgi:hypothetical protein